jgi:flagellar hook-length control protein FliK
VDASASAPAPPRRESVTRKSDAEPTGDETSQLVQPEAATILEVAAAVVPELVVPGTGRVEDLPAPQAEVEQAPPVSAEGFSAATAAAGTAAAAGAAGEAGAADAAGTPGAAVAGESADKPVVDPRTPNVLPVLGQAVATAVESNPVAAAANAGSDGAPTPAPTGEAVAIESAPITRPVGAPVARPAAARPETSLRATDTSALRAEQAAARPELAAPSSGGDRENASQDRAARPQATLVPAVEVPRAESPDAAQAAVSAPAASDIADSAAATQDFAVADRVDVVPPSQTMRAPEPLSPMQTGRPMPAAAPDAIAIQTDWLATRGGGTARLVLHPPELGEIAIRVTVRNQAVDVVMVAHTALAHQVAEDQSDRLSAAFAHRDLRLEQFEIRRGDPSDASSTGQFGSSDAGARERERAQDEQRSADRGGFGRGGLRRGGIGGDAVAPAPRIVSADRAAAIDLRI